MKKEKGLEKKTTDKTFVSAIAFVPIVPIPNGAKNGVWAIPVPISTIFKRSCETIVSVPRVL